MLNPYWKNQFDERDFDMWNRIDSTTPPFYPNTELLMDNLIKKYYRNESGSSLSSRFNVNQRKAILEKTMKELEKALATDRRNDIISWRESQENEESLDSKLQRQEDLFERASLRSSKMLQTLIRKASPDDASLDRYWIDPVDKEHYVGNFPGTHMQWLRDHQEVLSNDEKEYMDKFKGSSAEGAAGYFYKKGWIRISENVVLIYSKNEMEQLADFLIKHQVPLNKVVTVIMASVEMHKRIKVANIIKEYSSEKVPMVANGSSTVPNPIRKNYDYGEIPNYIDRLKWFNKKERRKNRSEKINKI